jgi:preprotein translocase subunit SecD
VDVISGAPAARRVRPLWFVLAVGLVAVTATALGVFARSSPSPPTQRAVLSPLGPATPRQLQDAAALLRLRLDDYGRGAKVVVSAGQLVVDAPQDATGALDDLARAGQLAFRPVLEMLPSPAGDSPSAALLAPFVCDGREAGAVLTSVVVLCSVDGQQRFRLGPARVVGSDLQDVTLGKDANGSPAVVMGFTSAGQRAISRVSADLATERAPGNRLAIVVDGEVVSAPTIVARIGGEAQVNVLSVAEARALAAVLRYGSLPLSFVVSSA